MMKENPALLAIDYLDKAGNRVSGLPNYSERPDRLPPVNDPLILDAIQRGSTLGTPAYSQVIEQYAPLWVLAVPILIDEQNQGTVLATYDLNILLSQKVPWWFVQRYNLSLIDRDNKQLSPRDGARDIGIFGTHCRAAGRVGDLPVEDIAALVTRTPGGAAGTSQRAAFQRGDGTFTGHRFTGL
jgi:hypothetical protein